MKKVYLYILTFFLFCKVSYSATCTLTASTNWTVASSWSCGRVPLGTDNINIPNGYTVTITTDINLSAGNLTDMTIAGTLFFSGNASKLELPSTATVYLTSTGVVTSDVGNNSQKFKIGNNTVWTSNSGTVTGPSSANSSSGALPVELLDFSGNCGSNSVQLNWSTATETDNAYFLVEKSTNGTEWQYVAKVMGNGTTGIVHHYIHTDYEVTNELTYYRLSQVDQDQTKTIFRAIDMNCGNNVPDQMVLFSNPASTELNLLISVNNLSDNNTIKVINNAGEIVMNTKITLTKGLNSFIFPIDIGPGMYHVLFSSEEVILPSQKLLIIK